MLTKDGYQNQEDNAEVTHNYCGVLFESSVLEVASVEKS